VTVSDSGVVTKMRDTSHKISVAWISVAITTTLIIGKLIIGLFTDSLAILSQAADSGFDLIALLITLFAVKISAIPPDEDHPYGHGKFENLSALIQAIFLLGITIWISYDAIQRLRGVLELNLKITTWSFAILLVSIGLDLYRAQLLRKAGKEHNSQALEASALNFLTDILSAVVALIGLVIAKVFDYPLADAWAALGVAVFVAYLSVQLGKRAIDGLTDRFEFSKGYEELNNVIQSVTGVEKVRRMRIRLAGPYHFIETTIEVSRALPFNSVQHIVEDVEKVLMGRFQNADVTVHWVPVKTENESPFETLRLITAQYGISPHNVELTRGDDGELRIDYHLEFPPRTDFSEAHAISEEIEKQVRSELPRLGRVTPHLEEERSDKNLMEIKDLTDINPALVNDIEFYAKAANKEVKGVQDISISENLEDRGIKLILTINLRKELSLGEAHDIVTNVEEELRKRFPEIHRIVIHASPNNNKLA